MDLLQKTVDLFVAGRTRFADGDVVGQGQRLEQPRNLESAPHAQPRHPVGRHIVDSPSVQQDLSRRNRVEPAEAVQKSTLSGSVHTDDAGDRAGLRGEADAVERHQPAECLTDIVDFQPFAHSLRPPAMPCGST